MAFPSEPISLHHLTGLVASCSHPLSQDAGRLDSLWGAFSCRGAFAAGFLAAMRVRVRVRGEGDGEREGEGEGGG